MSHTYQKLVVLQVLPALVAGGVERGTLEIAEALTQAGHTSIIASRGGPLVRLAEAQHTLHITGPYHSKNPFVILCNALRLYHILKQHQVHVLHVRSRAPAWSAWIAARLYGKCALISTFHGYYRHHTAFKRWYNGRMAATDHVICGSRFVYDHVRTVYHVDTRKMSLIPRGIDMHYFSPDAISSAQIAACRAHSPLLAEHRKILLLPGRVTSWKGHQVALEALALLQQKWPNLTLLFVGHRDTESRYVQQLEEWIHTHQLDDHIVWAPHQADVRPWYLLADIVLSASTAPETFGRVMVEAQAMGRPVIATALGGSTETIIPDQTGWLVPPADAEALAHAIDHALTMRPEELHAIRDAARTHVTTHYPLSHMCQETLAIYAKYAMIQYNNRRPS